MAESIDSPAPMLSRGAAAGAHDTVHESGEPAGNVITEFLDAARSAAESLLHEQKRQVADRISGVGGALRSAVGPLDRSQNAIVARVIEEAAERVESFSRTLHSRQWHELVADTEEFARRQPTLFVLGAVVSGFLLGRLLWTAAGRQSETRSGETTRAVTAAVSSASGAAAGDELAGSTSLSPGGWEAR